jgi:putative transposase
MSLSRRKEIAAQAHDSLSISKRCELLGVNRSSFYYQPKPISEENLRLMRAIDEQFMKTPVYGYQKMTDHLNNNCGFKVWRERVRRKMRKMGLKAIYRKPRTSQPHPEHKIYPYLLKGMEIDKPNKVWCSDITYIIMEKGFLYLTCIMDWYSRKILSWRLSNTLEADFCVDALNSAIEKYGVPEVFNSDQGCQYTSFEFTNVLIENSVQISMDGKGRCMDNIMVERLWRTLKYDYIYLYSLPTGLELRGALRTWIEQYNSERPHSSLDGQTPDAVYFRKSTPGHALGCPATVKVAC